VADPATQKLDKPVLDDTMAHLSIQGPQAVLARIDHVTALVSQGAPIAATTLFENMPVIAYDTDGAPVDLSLCVLAFDHVTVTVPVLTLRVLPLTATVTGAASVTVAPASLTVWATDEQASALADRLTQKLKLDVSAFGADNTVTVDIRDITANMEIVGGVTAVTVTITP
ncbi:MAG: hypothetical protein FWF49_06005, partial [Oscillospiraceae bacterium]|nr:hypothetical protein [Oscillospiraceae bacterium]